VDKYEASVWQVDPHNTALVNQIQSGTVTLADLQAGGAVQLGCTGAPFNATAYPGNFPAGGQWTPVFGSDPPSPGVYAASVPGVLPSTCIDWFQAAQACALSGKRLITNREWQDAAAGTPDPGNADDGSTTCATISNNPAKTGARTNCKSSWGAFDMIGNVYEWVTDWADRSNVGCTDWTTQTGLAGADVSCFGGNGSNGVDRIPGALLRGGAWVIGSLAGVFAVRSDLLPVEPFNYIGFRCAR
jgi:formylglycine-generating enzyme required for sulfatase activity